MAITMRRGLNKDFNPAKMTAGEWAVSTDTKYVHMCFSTGVVARMATYEAFEEDMKEIQIILATCQDIQTAVERFSTIAEQHKNQAETYSIESKSWAVGGTGSRTGEDTNNSKYFSIVSKKEADRAKQEADRASSIVGIGIATNTTAGIVKGNADEFAVASDGKLSITSSYTLQSELAAINGTENKKTLFGKFAKTTRELINHIADKTIHFKLTNNLLATVAGTALDAVQGKALDDKITDVNRKLDVVGTIFNVSPSADVALSTSTKKAVMTGTLQAGVYIITCSIGYSITTMLRMDLIDASTGAAFCGTLSGATTFVQIANLTKSTTLQLMCTGEGVINRDGSMNYMNAIRIK